MTPFPADLKAHLSGGLTTLARAWAVYRRDGQVLGFTDHDRALTFDGVTFRADTGMTAQAVEQSTGLSVDNTEALGTLSSAAIREADIRAGRFDGAEVRAWLVNWADPAQRVLLFRGTMGEFTRTAAGFRVELRGLAEALNQPQGRAFQKPCSAVLGDAGCGVDLSQPGYSAEAAVLAAPEGAMLRLAALPGFAPGWFERGRLRVLDGAGEGLAGVIKADREGTGAREITLWEELRAPLAVGDLVRIEAGCDKRPETCRLKFANLLNFRGFPDIPGDDWLMAYPHRAGANDGGSLR